jgi:hypothetical protein
MPRTGTGSSGWLHDHDHRRKRTDECAECTECAEFTLSHNQTTHTTNTTHTTHTTNTTHKIKPTPKCDRCGVLLKYQLLLLKIPNWLFHHDPWVFFPLKGIYGKRSNLIIQNAVQKW